MTANGSPSWKVIAGFVLGILVALLGWFSRGLAQDVRDHEKRITVMEVDVYNKVADLEDAVDKLTTVVGTVRDSLNARRTR